MEQNLNITHRRQPFLSRREEILIFRHLHTRRIENYFKGKTDVFIYLFIFVNLM